MKYSLITTVLNEEENIENLIDSINSQTILPNEIIVVDGGSKDQTVNKINKKKIQFPKLNIKLFIKKGNRSVGRNEAIRKSSDDIILCTDAGCVLDKNWVKNITKNLNDKTIDIVSGYYKPKYKNTFQKSLATYTSVMPDKLDKENFLPSSRSMAFRKKAWEKVGGFPEELNTCEDLVFDKKLKEKGFRFKLAEDAIVYWPQRKDIFSAFKQFYSYALGDGYARYFRQNTPYLFIRYIFAVYLICLNLIEKSTELGIVSCFLIILYILWSIIKNYKYVHKFAALIYLPVLQITSDFAVIFGTTTGFLQSLSPGNIFKSLIKWKAPLLIIACYILLQISVINQGVPNISHPFNYFMDEWHQSQSVRNLFKFGTPNIAGSANGSIFQFFLTGIYLIPFYLLHIINPFAIKSSVLNLDLQTKLFEVLRLNTLIFGSLSIIVISYIGKKYFKIQPFLTAFLFTVNPIWIMLGNYFKYDIALMFWILVSLLFFLRYIKSLSFLDLVAAAFFSGLSLATKLSAIPLLPLYIVTFVIFTPGFYKKLSYLFKGILVYLATFLIFGIPDIILGKGSLAGYLSSNLISSPQATSNYRFGSNYFSYLILRLYPITFGHLFYYIFLVFLIALALILVSNFRNRRTKKWTLPENKYYAFFIICFFFFFLSLIPLKLGAVGNRVLVLLPFIAITVGLFISRILIQKNIIIKYFSVLLILLIVCLQSAETYIWFKLKLDIDPRVASSDWIVKNVKKGTVIGLENIPIYQEIPDILLKEFYLAQYKKEYNFLYRYEIIDYKSKRLPSILVLTDMDMEYKYVIKSSKNNLTNRIRKENYKLIKQFEPNFKFFNLIGNQLDFNLAGLSAIPSSISIYEK